ncbi:outer membrane receptor protein involved in Fe transport [Chitinophaga dinghuensis]|uniref:Outer membrane receptor protein involved in Fe transport n=1 Tax=Chitinophaga dinghuensis TaxID=1539050 RepID=A0A327VYK6_9BACT|nr:TonB-dependent receptor plug domain-containing protein [Chitinophaga dinghuensis]RAJ80280.1 outer membrane receptor protein involved in Fe transport [Chitinophaga dinghuensis]
MNRRMMIAALMAVGNHAFAGEPQDSIPMKESHLSQIEVTAPRVERSMLKVDLKMTPVNTAQDLLRKVPGLFIAQHAGGGKAEQIFLRGFDNDHGTDINISADGIPVNMVSHAHGQGYADLHFLIPETIEGIDFGKGAYYPSKGDLNTSGYVSFHTFDSLSSSMVKLEGGSFNTIRGTGLFNLLHKSGERAENAYIAADYGYTDGPFDVPQHFNRLNLFGKYNKWLNNRNYISFLASTFHSSWNASGQIPERAVEEGLISRWGSIDPTEGGSTQRTNAAFTWRHIFNNNAETESFFYYTHYEFNLFSNFTFFLKDPVNGDEIQQRDDRNMFGFQQKYTQNFGNFRWESGVGFRMDDITDLELNHVYRRDSLLGRESWGNGTETNLYAYTGLEWRKNGWSIAPGLRFDEILFKYHDKLLSSTGRDQAARVSPKLNFSYSPNPHIQWYLKTGLGFHSNDMRVVIQEQGRQIMPMSAGADLGAVWKPIHNLLIQPAIWYTYLQQEFVYVGDDAVVEPSGKTRRLGVDLSVRYQPVKWLYLDADVNYAHGRFIDEPKGENYIPLAPVLTSTGGAAVQFGKGFSANMRYRYMKARPANEDNSVTAHGYFVNDLALAYTRGKLDFTLGVQNLFNVNWNEAQFETETRLRNEPNPVTELCFTPGTPFALKAGIAVRF